jgi:hypothetical protein
MLSSTIYTIGTALGRARDSSVAVEVLVDGTWIQGDVSAVDGHGVVLQCVDGGLAMIRVERIDVVLVRQTEAFEGREQDEVQPVHAHPMPAPADERYGSDPPVVRPRASIEGHWRHSDRTDG